MEYHNNYLNSTHRKIVKVANPLVEYTTDNGENISFRNWLLQSQLHGESMIDGVESMKDGVVRIIYDKKFQQGVDFIMKTLQQNAIEAFGEKIVKEMLGEDHDVLTHFNSDMEDQHAEKLKAIWNGKQVQHTSPPKQQHRLYYGNNKSEKLYKHDETRSYSAITQSTLSQSTLSQSEVQVADSQCENEELRKMVSDLTEKIDSLEQQHQSFQKNLKASIKRELTVEFEGVINDFREEMNATVTTIENKMNATVTTIENKFDQTIKKYETSTVEREQRLQEQGLRNFRILAAELLKNSTLESPSETSDTSSDLRGGNQ